MAVMKPCFSRMRPRNYPYGRFARNGDILQVMFAGAYRVKLSETQAIVGFPKYSTIGIGFAQEEDWNTNLPWTTQAEEIFAHIAHNKGDSAISDEQCIEAIRMIQAERS